MQIWTCLSARALREIDARGGLDEYMMSVGDEKFGKDSIALMYRNKIADLNQSQTTDTSSLKNRMMNLLREKYGSDYLEKVEKLQKL